MFLPPRCTPLTARRLLAVLLRGLLGLLLAGAAAFAATDDGSLQVREAVLITGAGERAVELPHRLEPGDFAPEGGRVRYRLELDLPRVPDAPLGVFVRKLSLSGALSINGRPAAVCDIGALETLRCLHRPHLFVPPNDLWRAGRNTIEFEIFANARQMNGLGTVLVGDAATLDRGPYRSRMLWQVETVHALTWITLTMGLLSLAVGIVLRTESVYLWFGLTSLANAASNLNVLITAPPVAFETFSWFVFASRLASAPLMLMTMLAFFGKATPSLRRVLGGSALGLPLLLLAFGDYRWTVIVIYVPILVAIVVLLIAIIRWTTRSRRPADVLMTLSYTAMFFSVPLDYVRLIGKGAFEGVYLTAYTSAGVMAVTGALLVSLLASSLATSRRLTATLDHEVALRTADLEQANVRLAELSSTDGLTGIANRRRFDESLDAEWKRARREGCAVSLLMIDVDHFKHYNDALGHQAGDDCLKQVAQALREHAARPGDLVARYGGEEFALLTPADAESALRLGGLLRDAVFALDLPHPDSPEGRVTISVGVATLTPGDTDTSAELIRRADEALYAAKRKGRNRVEGAGAKLSD